MPRTVIRLILRTTAAAVHHARHRIVAEARSWGALCDEEVAFRLEVVVAELLTDGLLHASGPLTVEVALAQGLFVVEVRHGGSAAPRPGQAGSGDVLGRGLALVQALSLFRDTERTAAGTRCWAVLPAVTAAVAVSPGAGEPSRPHGGSAPPEAERWSVTPAGRSLLSSLFPAT
ncbi:ATP-binding protein [Streptomyces sp. NPDC001056]